MNPSSCITTDAEDEDEDDDEDDDARSRVDLLAR